MHLSIKIRMQCENTWILRIDVFFIRNRLFRVSGKRKESCKRKTTLLKCIHDLVSRIEKICIFFMFWRKLIKFSWNWYRNFFRMYFYSILSQCMFDYKTFRFNNFLWENKYPLNKIDVKLLENWFELKFF